MSALSTVSLLGPEAVQGSFATDMIHCGLVVYAVVYVSV